MFYVKICCVVNVMCRRLQWYLALRQCYGCSPAFFIITLSPPRFLSSILCALSVFFTAGIIKHGGERPNIIPAYTELEFYLRTPLSKDLCDLKAKAEACFRAAAAATGCQVSFTKNSHIVICLVSPQ